MASALDKFKELYEQLNEAKKPTKEEKRTLEAAAFVAIDFAIDQLEGNAGVSKLPKNLVSKAVDAMEEALTEAWRKGTANIEALAEFVD